MNGNFATPSIEWIGPMWGVWLLYWFISAGGARATKRREDRASRLSYVLPIVLGVGLMARANTFWPTVVLVPHTDDSLRLALALVALGLGFSIWARWHLGRNWSAAITAKEGHELIRSGPYAWVRHPIYTGMLTAGLGTAVALGGLNAFMGWAIVTAGYIRKFHIEERWMREVFGEQYTKYVAEVDALVPFVY
jgi:protein-S-isoprenylcysteine O-methyltransferase Ste14